MKRHLRAAAVAATAFLPLAAGAQQSISLTQVARTLGYHYAYLGPDDAVELSRPGLAIILRPGAPLFDVNDRTVPVTGDPPVYSNGDLYVSRAMVATLRRLAGPNATVGRAAMTDQSLTMRRPHGPVAVNSISATQIESDQALRVVGQATPYAPITLTLMARVSKSIPDIVVSRSHVSADRDGLFKARVAIAPVFFTGSLYTVVAATDSDTTRSVTTTVTEFPNGKTKVPSEELERGIR